jgi:hypothetical protein
MAACRKSSIWPTTGSVGTGVAVSAIAPLLPTAWLRAGCPGDLFPVRPAGRLP